jgi:tetratricopeptide (TPR) repeat protein
MPEGYHGDSRGDRGTLQYSVEQRIVQNAPRDTFYAVFNPHAVSLPSQLTMHPFGILYRPLPAGNLPSAQARKQVWSRYATASIYGSFHQDFMHRHLSARFNFALGRYLFGAGQQALGLNLITLASRIGYDDTIIHADIALFLIGEGLLKEARTELEKALVYGEDLGGVHTNWGYYYLKLGDYEKAAASYARAVAFHPDSFKYYNNLGIALHKAGENDKAAAAFRQSLAIKPHQPAVLRFMKDHLE